MAKPASRKLKVFQAQIGFYDTVVAAPNQTAALSAWGIHQNLFASGDARVATDEAAAAAALAHPDTPLRRAVGSSAPFQIDPDGLPEIPDAPKKPAAKPASKTKPDPAPAPPADRSELDAAEAALKALDQRRKREEAGLRQEEAALEVEMAAAQAAYVEARTAATASIVSARQAYRKAGGQD